MYFPLWVVWAIRKPRLLEAIRVRNTVNTVFLTLILHPPR